MPVSQSDLLIPEFAVGWPGSAPKNGHGTKFHQPPRTRTAYWRSSDPHNETKQPEIRDSQLPLFMDRPHKVGITGEEIRDAQSQSVIVSLEPGMTNTEYSGHESIKGFDAPIPVYSVVSKSR